MRAEEFSGTEEAHKLSSLLVVVGALWALLGLANIFLMPWSTAGAGSPILTYGLIFNGLAFVMPGLVVIGIGEMLRKKSSTKSSEN